MPESIESFVERLQREGIEAGREKAAKALEEARTEAEQLLARARAESEAILEKARKEAQEAARRAREELRLAVRDAILALRERIVSGLEGLLRSASGATLCDPGFMGGLIRELVGRYAEGDASGARRMDVRVSDQALEELGRRALADLVDERRVGLSGALAAIGLEYSVAGGKVEVTAESVGAMLAELAGPRLREVIDRALAPEA